MTEMRSGAHVQILLKKTSKSQLSLFPAHRQIKSDNPMENNAFLANTGRNTVEMSGGNSGNDSFSMGTFGKPRFKRHSMSDAFKRTTGTYLPLDDKLSDLPTTSEASPTLSTASTGEKYCQTPVSLVAQGVVDSRNSLASAFTKPGFSLRDAADRLMAQQRGLSHNFVSSAADQQPTAESESLLFHAVTTNLLPNASHAGADKIVPAPNQSSLRRGGILTQFTHAAAYPSSPQQSPISLRSQKQDPRHLTFSGFMYKQGNSWKNWQKRYFVLQNGNLFYFKSKLDAARKGALPLGVIPLTTSFVIMKGHSPGKLQFGLKSQLNQVLGEVTLKKNLKDNIFRIETLQRIWHLCPETELEQMDWIRVLQEVSRGISKGHLAPLPSSSPRTEKSGIHSDGEVYIEGWLEKHSKNSIKRRWCVLNRNSLDLFKAPGDDEPCTQFPLDYLNNFLEIMCPGETDNDPHCLNSPASAAEYRFAIHMNRGRYCHWFVCEDAPSLESWVYALLCLVPLMPACKTVFETLISGVVYGIVEHCKDIDLEDSRSLQYVDAVCNENAILCYEKDIARMGLPLTALPSSRLCSESLNIAKALILFSNTPIQMESIEYHFGLVNALLQSCLTNPSLQNELLLQLTKQTTNHPSPSSRQSIQLWQLFSLALSLFSPIREAFNYIKLHLVKVANQRQYHTADEDLVREFAFFCLRMLMHSVDGEAISYSYHPNEDTPDTLVIQSRKFPPSYMEMMHILKTLDPPKPMRILVDCKNEEILSLPIEPFSKVGDVIGILKTALNVGGKHSPLPSEEFRLYLRFPPSHLTLGMDKMEILDSNTYIGDVIYRIDSLLRKRASKASSSSPQKTEDWWWSKDLQTPYLVFKIRFFLPKIRNSLPLNHVLTNDLTDVEKRFLISYTIRLIEGSNMTTSELTSLSSLYAQAKWGDHFPMVQDRNLIHSQMHDVIRLFHKSSLSTMEMLEETSRSTNSSTNSDNSNTVPASVDSLVADISKKWMALRGKSASECMNLYLLLVSEFISVYEFKVFVESNGKDLGEMCKVHLSREGMSISMRSRFIIQAEYEAVLYFVGADEKSVVMGLRNKTVDDRFIGKKGSSDTTKVTLLLADENISSHDFIVIFSYFSRIGTQ